ncbi:uncharacterized protein LOC123297322 [Chrysoperla carnea]|uniref:uncharacterized protein LOC123297322 n=1 Tax=Chrysoperla carnea TaxID=189513 RepID=UPI001D09891F|nr:uncharacterized protein LOC123297322 [Chrysoperla carnea]
MINVCRLCGSNSNDLINIFSKDSESVQYITKIKSCFPILIYRSDPLSKYICSTCGEKIDSFYQFKSEIIENNKQAINNLLAYKDSNGVEIYLNSLKTYNGLEEINKIKKLELEENDVPTNNIHSEDDDSCKSSNNNAAIIAELLKLQSETEKELSAAANRDQSSLLKILSPTNINNTAVSEDDDIKKRLNEIVKTESKPQLFEPKTLLQLALHTINLKINPNYQAEEKMRLKMRAKRREFIEFERRWKLSMSSRSVNKRTFDECIPVFNNLLNTWQPPIKQIKLESINPLAPEICITLKKTEETKNSNSNGLDIRLEYPQNRCRYCFKDFCDIQQLALHEGSCHIQVFVGARIDSDFWRDYEENMDIRNKWLERRNDYDFSSTLQIKEELFSDEDEEEEEDDIPEPIQVEVEVNINEEDDPMEDINGEAEMVDYEDRNMTYEDTSYTERPYEERPQEQEAESYEMEPLNVDEGKVGDVPFHSLSKKERFQYYKIVYESGLKRRECPFCRRSFKDGWSVDDHILKNRCRFICPFCHTYFQKEEHDTFYRHLDEHKHEPNYHKHTARWKKNIIRSQQLFRSQQMQQMYQRSVKIEPIKMKYLLERQNNSPPMNKPEQQRPMAMIPPHLLGLQMSGGSDSGNSQDVKRVAKPYRSYYCRNCYKIFYQEHDLNLHYPKCCEENPATEIGPPNGLDMNSDTPSKTEFVPFTESSSEASPAPKQVFRCGFCPAVFYNSNARNSHMRVHKEKLYKKKPPMMVMGGQQHSQQQHYQQLPQLQPKPAQAAPPRVMDENLARLASNPHITIKPSNVKKSSQPQEDNSSAAYPRMLQHLVEPVMVTERSFQCNPCGTSHPSQKALYEHKRTCPETLAQNAGYLTLPLAGNDRRKFRCTQCNRRFNSKGNLMFHRKSCQGRGASASSGGGQVFECPFCKRKFATESQYTTHILYNHPE